MLELSYNFSAVDSPSTKINGQTNETYSATYIYIFRCTTQSMAISLVSKTNQQQ